MVIKKRAKRLPSSFEKKKKKSLREDGCQKITPSSQGFDLIHKMSIYKLKLGVLGLLNCIWTFKGSMSQPTSKHDILGLKMKF